MHKKAHLIKKQDGLYKKKFSFLVHYRTGIKFTMFKSITEINHQSNNQPDPEPDPVGNTQLTHHI